MAPELTRRGVLRAVAAAGGASLAGCGSGATDAEFVAPEATLVDDRLDVQLRGLTNARQVRVEAQTTVGDTAVESGTEWSATATFRPSDGTVSLRDQAPLSGAYDGVDPMGLFWAMRATPDPAQAAFPPTAHEVTLAASVDGTQVAATTIQRRLSTDGVTSRRLKGDRENGGNRTVDDDEDGDGTLVGTLHTPPGTGQAPGVVLLHGGFAREMRPTARLLAAHGFVALSLQYFGTPDTLPDVLSEVPVEYAQRAVGRVLNHPRVEGSVGVWGVSKGAELALVLASHDSRVGAVVGTAPSSVAWEGYDADGYPTGTSSWTVDGEPVPYLEYASYDAAPPSADPFDHPRAFYEYTQLQASPEAVETATIPVERIDGTVQLFSGTADRLWHSTPMGNRVVARLDGHDHPQRFDHRAFEGAGHVITLPYLPTYGLSDSAVYPLGGAPEPNARASREHWPTALSTLAATVEGFEPESPSVSPSGSGSGSGPGPWSATEGATTVETGGKVAATVSGCIAVLAGIYRGTGRKFTHESLAEFLRSAAGGGAFVAVALALATTFAVVGLGSVAVVPALIALLVVNDMTTHRAWEWLDDYFERRERDRSSERDRELRPPRVSRTTKIVVVLGTAQLVTFLVFITLFVFVVVR